MGEFCERHDLIIISDEIHCDLILDEGLRHISMLALDDGVSGYHKIREQSSGVCRRSEDEYQMRGIWAVLTTEKHMQQALRLRSGEDVDTAVFGSPFRRNFFTCLVF